MDPKGRGLGMCDPLHLPFVKVTLSEKITLILERLHTNSNMWKIVIVLVFSLFGKKSFYCFSNIAINVSLLVVDR